MAKTALVDAAVSFCLVDAAGPARTLLLDRMQQVMPDLAGVTDGPLYPLRINAQRLIDVWRAGSTAEIRRATDMLIHTMRSLFLTRSDASLARQQGKTPPVA